MSIFDRIPARELGAKYTHYGWFGLCPVYVGGIDQDPVVSERNGIPAWWLAVNEWLLGQAIFLMSIMQPDYEPMWPIRVGAPLDSRGANK